MPARAARTTGAKTSTPFPGEARRASWPGPKGSAKRPARPAAPRGDVRPRARTPRRTAAARKPARKAARRGQRTAIATASTPTSATSSGLAATARPRGRPARPAHAASSSARARKRTATPRKKTDTGCGHRAWLAAHTGVPKAKTAAARAASASGHRRPSATNSAAAARLLSSDATTLPASAAAPSSPAERGRQGSGPGRRPRSDVRWRGGRRGRRATARAVTTEGSAAGRRSSSSSWSGSGGSGTRTAIAHPLGAATTCERRWRWYSVTARSCSASVRLNWCEPSLRLTK